MNRLVRDRLSRAHYIDAALYDHRYARRRHDIAFYVAHAKSPCLELGAGTGRITRALVAAGHTVTALEREPSMRQRLMDSGARIVGGDMRAFSPQKKFATVLAPFHVLSHVHESADLVALLTRIKGWLAPGGRFIFDIPMPNAYLLALSPARRYRVGFATVATQRYRYLESFDYDPVRQLQTVIAHYDHKDADESFVVPLLHRHYFPQELRALIAQAGLRLVSHAGDFAGGELGSESEEQVIIVADSEFGEQ